MTYVRLYYALAIYYGLVFGLSLIGIAHAFVTGAWGWFIFDIALAGLVLYFALDAQSEGATLKQTLDDE